MNIAEFDQIIAEAGAALDTWRTLLGQAQAEQGEMRGTANISLALKMLHPDEVRAMLLAAMRQLNSADAEARQ